MNVEDLENTFLTIHSALEVADSAAAVRKLTELHPSDRSELFNRLERDQQELLFPEFDSQIQAELLEKVPEEVAASLAENMATADLADVLDEVSPNIAADILGDIATEKAAPTLEQMEDAETVRPLLEHEDDTAGGIMTPEFVAIRVHMTVGGVIDFLKHAAKDVPSTYYLYVVDEQKKLVGVLGLRELILANHESSVESIMMTKVFKVTEGTDQEEVAATMKKYRLTILPVVDSTGVLKGVVTQRELVEVIEEEATEDIYRLASISSGDVQFWSPMPLLIKKRLPWLYVNLGTAFLAASVVNLFEATIAKLAVLATFQGIVAGQGGNAGTQTLAMMVRGMALNEVRFSDAWRVLKREILTGVIHGIAVGVAVALIAWWWKGIPFLGLAIGLAMIGNMIAAGLAGTIVPLGLKALRLDPALASAVLVTTVTDCVGFALFLGLATLLLPLM